MGFIESIHESILRYTVISLAAFAGYKMRMMFFEGYSFWELVPVSLDYALFFFLVNLTLV